MENLAGNLRLQKENNNNKTPKEGEEFPTGVADDRRLSGNELLSRMCGIFQAPGKAETGRIFVHEVRNGEHSACV